MKSIKNVMIFSQEYPPYSWGGVTPFTVNLVNGLKALGVEVQLITISEKEGYEKQENGVEVYRIPASGIYKDELIETNQGIRRHFQFLKKAKQVACEIKKPDAVILADGLCFPEAKACAFHFKVPLLTMVNQIFSDINDLWGGTLSSMVNLENRYFQESDFLVAGSRYMKERIGLLGYGSKTAQISYGWGFQNWSSKALCDLKPTDFVFVGRMVPEKGVSILIDAFLEVLQSKPTATLKLIGEGPIREIGEAQIKAHQIEKNVTFLGSLPWTQIHHAFQSAKYSVIPSYNEPFGYVALEAIMYGTIPIVSNLGGLKEITDCVPYPCKIPTQKQGPFISFPKVKLLSKKMIELLNLPENNRKEIVHKARVLATQKYNFVTVAAQWLHLMESLKYD